MEIITPHQALAKAYKFCAYQERSQQEVRLKLKSFLITDDEVENIIVNLIENNFINEERFAIAFAGGKFRINKWGKLKIKAALKTASIWTLYFFINTIVVGMLNARITLLTIYFLKDTFVDKYVEGFYNFLFY